MIESKIGVITLSKRKLTDELKSAFSDIDNEELLPVVSTCEWRIDYGGISACKGMLGPCLRIIEQGRCPTLQEHFTNLIMKNERGVK